MRFVSDRVSDMIDRVLSAETDNFVELVRTAGLSPELDFRNTILRGVDFSNCDLGAFDFSATLFEGCRFEGASIGEARFDGASFKDCDLSAAADWQRWSSANPEPIEQAMVRVALANGRVRAEGRPADVEIGSENVPPAVRLPQTQATGWEVRCLCEIINFAALRREIGTLLADQLVSRIDRWIEHVIPGVRSVSGSRAMVEIVFERSTYEAAMQDIQLLRAEFLHPFDIDGQACRLDMHMGAAAAPVGADQIRLAEAAEMALERARDEGRLVVIDLTREDWMLDRLGLVAALPRALAEDEMFVQYQPKVHVRRKEVVGVEALIRWQHPERGMLLPADFIPVAEDAGYISALTLWTLRRVIADQERLAIGGRDLRIFVNIEGSLLADSVFISEACARVRENGARIGFEITETAVIRDPESAIRNMRLCADNGIAIAIDDYGAGLSSLAYLKQLPASELKIDKMFIMQLTSSNRDPLIVRSTIDLAHALEMEVTAEGVETPSALGLLAVMGCDMVQGYLISRPLSIDAFLEFLADAGNLDVILEGKPSLRPESIWKRT